MTSSAPQKGTSGFWENSTVNDGPYNEAQQLAITREQVRSLRVDEAQKAVDRTAKRGLSQPTNGGSSNGIKQ